MPFTGANVGSAFGITADFWKIGQLYIDYENDVGFVNYLGYSTEEKAFTGKTPLATLEVRLDAKDITGFFGDATSTADLSAVGLTTIDYFDTLLEGNTKDTFLKGKTKTSYPTTKYSKG